MQHLAGLNQRQRLEQLVRGAEAARKDDEALRGLHEHRLAGVEVLERQLDVEVRVLVLFVWKVDVEADAEPAAFLAASVRGFHDTWAATGDHRPALLTEELRRRTRGGIRRRALADAGRAEDGNRRPVDPLDRLEPFVELLGDARGVLAELVLVLMRLVEELAVFHQSAPLGRVASIPSTSSAASPT